MSMLRSCLLVTCLVLTLDSVLSSPTESPPKSNEEFTVTETAERQDGDKLVFDEEFAIDDVNRGKTFYMPKNYEFTKVRLIYPKDIAIIATSYPEVPEKYKYTIKPKLSVISTKGLKYKVEIHAKPIVCEGKIDACKLAAFWLEHDTKDGTTN